MKRVMFYFSLIVIILLSFKPETLAKEAYKSMDNQECLIFDFNNSDETEDWRILNDGVMGGLSQSQIDYSDSNTAIFKGTVSLENNGGFASTRTIPRPYDLDGYNGILLRVKGDGRIYQLRLRTSDRLDGVSYRYPFATEADTWMKVSIPFHECVPVFRGRILEDVEPIRPEEIQQIGFLISNKQAGEFQLEIDWIKAYTQKQDNFNFP
ncbi:NADH:ubiquinone oxidoreductase complex I intermediate-associated protein 30 [Candidatus Scalindua japonica]|uniref:NADH:ubiquinone oxidoreductase complex I intermediate-associated protein 30 n=1 Tax=Candidatus Scalindua japonica TaxID=1284222 RepID=A0A286U350_9BACT|nr:CIA30 family protein [Candidatus Scalindua japonica]GAX62547.1 NADH:ubiquinone oxidoreductase complex I intermediate-associated protein 30 [Candidatus Scalindua japonica]